MKQFVIVALLVGLLQTAAFAQGRGRGLGHSRFNNLSAEEKARFRSARQAAMRDPSVAESRQRFQQARREFREKLRTAVLKADPSVQPILEKAKKQPTPGQP